MNNDLDQGLYIGSMTNFLDIQYELLMFCLLLAKSYEPNKRVRQTEIFFSFFLSHLPDESDSLWNNDPLIVAQHHCTIIVQHRTEQLHLTRIHLPIQLDDLHFLGRLEVIVGRSWLDTQFP